MRTLAKRVVLAGLLASVGPAGASPPFQLALADGSGWVSPGTLGNRSSVLLFWDSRCPPCIVELSNLAALRDRFPETVFVTVSLSSPSESQRVLARTKLPDAVVKARAPREPRGLLATLGNAAGALPFAAAFDATGQHCASVLGALSAGEMAALHHRCSKQDTAAP